MASPPADEAMRRAIALAARGLGTTSPNPVVGCVLLDADGEVVGEGFHAYAGGPHAEIVALAAGRRAGPRRHRRGHPGAVQPHRPHRPLHAQALIRAGVARVVVARAPTRTRSPAGGADTLRAAGRRGRDRGARARRPRRATSPG